MPCHPFGFTLPTAGSEGKHPLFIRNHVPSPGWHLQSEEREIGKSPQENPKRRAEACPKNFFSVDTEKEESRRHTFAARKG